MSGVLNPEPQGPFPAGLDHRLDGHLRGERQSHGAISACPANTSGPAKPQAGTPLDTGPLLQG